MGFLRFRSGVGRPLARALVQFQYISGQVQRTIPIHTMRHPVAFRQAVIMIPPTMRTQEYQLAAYLSVQEFRWFRHHSALLLQLSVTGCVKCHRGVIANPLLPHSLCAFVCSM